MADSTAALASIASATSWLAQIKTMPAERARSSVLATLNDACKASAALTPDNVRAVLHCDQELSPWYSDLLLSTLRNPGLTKQIIGPLAQTVGDTYTRLAQLYDRALTEQGGRALPDEFAALLACRGMAAIANRMKWTSLRLEQLDGPTWHLLHKLYALAEARGLHTRNVRVYPGLETNPGQAHVKTLLLATLGNGAFNSRELQTADEWLNEWTVGMQLDKQFDRNRHYYYVDLAEDSGARRVIGASAGKQLRFLSTDALALQIERTKVAFRQGQAKPSSGIDPVARAGEYAEFLEKAERIWSPTWMRADQRSFRRVPANDEPIAIVRGLRNLCNAAHHDYELDQGTPVTGVLTQEEEYDIRLYGFVREQTRMKLAKERAATLEPYRENWQLIDESLNGYGTHLPAAMDQDLRLGALLGIKRAKSNRWAVGYVARKMVRNDDKLFVGIEVLSHNPVMVTLVPEGERMDERDEATAALFIPGDQGRGRADSLIVHATLYAAGKDYNLSARNVSYFIRMPRVIRKGQGWQRVAFEVLGKRN